MFSIIAVDCGSPPSILNSIADYSATTFQSEALYTCDNGFEFSSGTETFSRMCEATAVWSDLNNAPSCER